MAPTLAVPGLFSFETIASVFDRVGKTCDIFKNNKFAVIIVKKHAI